MPPRRVVLALGPKPSDQHAVAARATLASFAPAAIREKLAAAATSVVQLDAGDVQALSDAAAAASKRDASPPASVLKLLTAAGARPGLLRPDESRLPPHLDGREEDDEQPPRELTEDEAAREQWREEMRARAQHRAYASLVSDLQERETTQNAAEGFKQASQQISIGVNLILSLLTAIAVGYYAGRHLFPHDPGATWATAIAVGVLLLLIEALLVVSRLSTSDAVSKSGSKYGTPGTGNMPPPKTAFPSSSAGSVKR